MSRGFIMPQKPSDRNYKAEYSRFHGKLAEKKKRAQRNAARAKVKKSGANVAGKDVGHLTPLASGGSNARSNLGVQTVAKNRGYKRGPTNRPIT
jgi:hypothetical protein